MTKDHLSIRANNRSMYSESMVLVRMPNTGMDQFAMLVPGSLPMPRMHEKHSRFAMRQQIATL